MKSKLSILIKKLISSILFLSGYTSYRLKNNIHHRFMVLMYHRVVPDHQKKKDGIQSGMYVSPDTFLKHIRFLQEHFEIIPLSGFSALDNANSVKQKPFCAVTFDDGWLDFFQNAYPVLKAERVPATIFLPTNYIGGEKWFWTDRLSFLLMNYKKNGNALSSNPVINSIENIKGDFETRLEAAIGMMKDHRSEDIENVLNELSARWQVDSKFNRRAFLSWEEVNEMKESGLVSYGSHTANHSILTTLIPDEIKEELESSKETLISKGVVDPSFIPFCYPNGNHNTQIAEMIKDSGYNLAVTTKNGWNEFGANPFTLKRIGIHQDMTSTEAMFACRIAKIL